MDDVMAVAINFFIAGTLGTLSGTSRTGSDSAPIQAMPSTGIPGYGDFTRPEPAAGRVPAAPGMAMAAELR